MLWEGRQLRDIREADVRRVVESALQEHLQLEYKSELYTDNDRGRREFLQDVAMFANTSGGVLLIGIPELRDDQGQPTGVPDAGAILGIEVANPETVLTGYDARVMEAVEERLPLESAAVEMGEGRYVLAIRVPNSSRKPHSVRHNGHIYFPARRERQRYPMNVREIKELVMRTASRLDQANQMLNRAFLAVPRPADLPYLMFGIIPVFFDDFLVDPQSPELRRAVERFNRTGEPEFENVEFTFEGLQRRTGPFEHSVLVWRNGLLTASSQVPLMGREYGDQHTFHIDAIDLQLRGFVFRATTVYAAAAISGPFVLSLMLRLLNPLRAVAGRAPFVEGLNTIGARDYAFPYMQVDNLTTVDATIRPFCDQAHQMFGQEGSPLFNHEGSWVGR